jgi:hypothetical protein
VWYWRRMERSIGRIVWKIKMCYIEARKKGTQKYNKTEEG